MSDFGLAELHYRRFYHLRLRGDAPPAWRHYESDPSDGSTAPIPLDFYWVNLPHEAPELIAGHGVMIPKLLQVMEETGP